VIDPAPTPRSVYTQALAKGGALLPETRSLLQAWQPGESSAAFAERVLREDVLARATAHRVRDIVRVFALRFLTPTDAPARHLQRLLAPTIPRQVFSDLVLHYAAQHDDLLHDYVVLCYWPAVREGSLIIRNESVQRLIAEAHHDGRIRMPWSPEIRRDMAGRVLIALTDFGFLQEDKPGCRQVPPYRPADGTIVYLAHLLHVGGVTDASLADQDAWALYGLEPRDVWNRLEGLAAEGWFVVQRAGQVVRITWTYHTVEEAVDALAGR
jgi:Putative inner membrane protein (DUF1819)